MINQQFRNKWRTLVYFIRSRYLLNFKSRERLEAWQKQQLQHFMRNVLPQAPFYQSYETDNISDLPIMDKSMMLADFEARNTQKISREQAMSLATQAEVSRDFEPTLGNVTVGMSSGTSGTPGLFLVSDKERSQWAGILLAKTLPSKFILHILQWWKPSLSIAFFLRANSNLYSTINSRRIDFRFYDLLQGVDSQLDKLNQCPPHALVAPATVLLRLAQLSLSGELKIQPQHIISVAEVLEADDKKLIETAFLQKVDQIYQATEGFLGYTCEQGNLHLNEAHIYIEKEWLDEQQTRFQPIITDFSRTTQLMVRYRLNDILRVADHACACGRVETCIAAIEGRADQILWLPTICTENCIESNNETINKTINKNSNEAINKVSYETINDKRVALYPDILRRAMMLVTPALTEYSITQDGMKWQIDLLTTGDWEHAKLSVSAAILNCCKNLNVKAPVINFGQWQALPLGDKRRRLWCNSKC